MVSVLKDVDDTGIVLSAVLRRDKKVPASPSRHGSGKIKREAGYSEPYRP